MENKIILGKNMLQEIGDIKSGLISTIGNIIASSDLLPENLTDSFNKIHIIACGTSYNSGLIGKKLIEKNLKMNCEVTIASEFILSESAYSKRTLFILVSQSGKTTDLLQSLDQLKKEELPTLAISNTENSPLVEGCKYKLILKAGEELAIASTKAFNCQVLAFITLIKYALAKNKSSFEKQMLKLKAEINKVDFSKYNITELQFLAHDISKQTSIYFLGKNTDYVLAIEGALKVKETCYIDTIAMPTQEVLHGTIAAFNEKSYVVFIINNKEYLQTTLNVIDKVYQTGAKIGIITSLNKKLFKSYNHLIKVPENKNEVDMLTSIIPLQYLAYNTSIILGNNPDSPRRLTKAVI